jgi:RHS repeat-associated protein
VGDHALRTQTLYDGFGRTMEARSYESGSAYISTTQSYDALGRVAGMTNPSRPGDGLNYQTVYGYDALGRTLSVTTPDGAATTSYSGNQTTMTDQAGKKKRNTYDGLGRLFNVREDPDTLNYTADYRYDALGNLTLVSLGYCQACQQRHFSYDSLGRLTQAVNPESGTVNYTYDGNGNLLTRTDNRAIKTTNTYDALNRVLSKSYSDGTPAVTYNYDASGVSNSIGQLTSVANASSVTNYMGFDALGRVTASNQQTGGQTYSFAYLYNLAGALKSETYPSGRVVTASYDGANRAYSMSGNLSGQNSTYVTQTAYWPHGAIYHYVRGNGVWYAASYNNRLQQTGSYEAINNDIGQMLLVSCPNWGVNSNVGIADICPHASGSNDNGNLQSADVYAGGPGAASSLAHFQQSFSYDGVNRLTAASDSGGWSRSFGYDQYGNGWVTANGGVPLAGNTPTSNVYTGANRINGQSYDAAGNMLAVNGDTVAYDAESRQISAVEPPSLGGGTESYLYDGAGQRVQKVGPSGVTFYVYDALGQLAAEYSTAAAQPPCTTCYLSYDHLGSVRMVMDQNANVVARHDFLPFGEEIGAGVAGRGVQWGPGTDNVNQKFTGKERDSETGLDFFGARYFSGAQGRFTAPDWSAIPQAVPYADLTNPQSLNLYSYVLNNPLRAADPDGHAQIDIRYTRIGPGYTHSYIVVTDTNGARTYFRAGPSTGGPSSGSSGALSSASGGSSGQSSNSNSNSSNSSSPGSGPGGGNANTGPFGALHADSGSYVPGTIDYETKPAASTTLLSNDQPAAGYIGQFQQYSDNINQSNIPYNPLTTNSNAYAAGAANFLGLTVPQPPVNAPGSGTPLPVPPPPPPAPPPPPCSVAGACPK